jgi:hypothetical protein
VIPPPIVLVPALAGAEGLGASTPDTYDQYRLELVLTYLLQQPFQGIIRDLTSNLTSLSHPD